MPESPGPVATLLGRLRLRTSSDGLRAPIKRLGRAGMPIWGTCAGAIVLAKGAGDLYRPSLGLMDIDVRRNAFGRQFDSFEADLDVGALGDVPFHAIFIRAPVIQHAGDGVEVLAMLADGTIVAAREGHLLATSFHPELTDDPRFHQLLAAIAERSRRDRDRPSK